MDDKSTIKTSRNRYEGWIYNLHINIFDIYIYISKTISKNCPSNNIYIYIVYIKNIKQVRPPSKMGLNFFLEMDPLLPYSLLRGSQPFD